MFKKLLEWLYRPIYPLAMSFSDLEVYFKDNYIEENGYYILGKEKVKYRLTGNDGHFGQGSEGINYLERVDN